MLDGVQIPTGERAISWAKRGRARKYPDMSDGRWILKATQQGVEPIRNGRRLECTIDGVHTLAPTGEYD